MIMTLLKYSFILGCTAFGGPAAHIALLQREWIDGKKWATHDEFLNMLAITNLIPGPNSTEMVMHMGQHKAGFKGLIVAGVAFIFPAAVLTAILTQFYQYTQTIPVATSAFYGISVCVLALISVALLKLGNKVMTSWTLLPWMVSAAVLTVLEVPEAISILGVAVAAFLYHQIKGKLASFEPVTLTLFGLHMVKIGCILFGSGYVLIAYLERTFIHDLKWITQAELLDVVALGQLTPGPVLTTATALGQLLFGWPGAVVGTLAIFLPAFVGVGITHSYFITKKPKWLASLIPPLNAAVLGMMAVVLVQMGLHLEWTMAGLIAFPVYAILLYKTSIPTLLMFGVAALLGVLGV
jgi:chromate transporter